MTFTSLLQILYASEAFSKKFLLLQMNALDVSALTIAGTTTIGYLLRYVYTAHSARKSVFIAQNMRMIRFWVARQAEKQDPNSLLVGIHTFRNTMMVAIFIGGAVFSYALSDLQGISQHPLHKRICIIAKCAALFSSFLCWTQVLRAAMIMGYTLTILDYEPEGENSSPAEKEAEKKKLIRSCIRLGKTLVFCVG